MYEDKTPEAIRQEILDATAVDISTVEGSFASDMAAPISVELFKVYSQLDKQLQLLFIEDLGGNYVDKRAAEYGLTRKPGVKATGAVTLTGIDGSVLPMGSVVLTADNLRYITDADATVTGGAATVNITAEAIGAEYNVPAASIASFYRATAGFTAVTNAAAITGGVDIESDDDLIERLLHLLQTPATSGNIYHYEQWALEVPGVGAAKIIPLWDGNGTVKVIVVGADMAPVDTDIVTACATHIETVRPIGATVTVVSAEACTINVAATVEIAETTTVETVQAALSAAVGDYIASIAFDVYEISINKVAYLLMGIDGVVDYASLTINGGTANITVDSGAVPVKGAVTVSAAD